uniref:Uncharacterized protein n=1 Tax=Strigamia maritima TaxID=126957 RepID=T1JDW3_STRMM
MKHLLFYVYTYIITYQQDTHRLAVRSLDLQRERMLQVQNPEQEKYQGLACFVFLEPIGRYRCFSVFVFVCELGGATGLFGRWVPVERSDSREPCSFVGGHCGFYADFNEQICHSCGGFFANDKSFFNLNNLTKYCVRHSVEIEFGYQNAFADRTTKYRLVLFACVFKLITLGNKIERYLVVRSAFWINRGGRDFAYLHIFNLCINSPLRDMKMR